MADDSDKPQADDKPVRKLTAGYLEGLGFVRRKPVWARRYPADWPEATGLARYVIC